MNHVEICEVSFMYEEWKHLTSLIRNLSCMLLSIYNFQQMLEKTCTLEKTYPIFLLEKEIVPCRNLTRLIAAQYFNIIHISHM